MNTGGIFMNNLKKLLSIIACLGAGTAGALPDIKASTIVTDHQNEYQRIVLTNKINDLSFSIRDLQQIISNNQATVADLERQLAQRSQNFWYLQEQYRNADYRYRTGQGTSYDLDNIKHQIDENYQIIATLQNQLKSSRDNLNDHLRHLYNLQGSLYTYQKQLANLN